MKKTLISLIVVIIIILILPLTVLAGLDKSRAAYNANNLISDSEFINWRTLDATGVQQFLNSKAGTRLRTFSEAGRSAAQIIADAARANSINPFVILATIQKEESLVESNYNFDFRVNWAMGYGVCDSCSLDDPNVAKYRGFTNQINNGTWQLKRNYSYWAANGSEWNVGRTMIIDGVAVRFGTRATSSLYRYTPHLHGNQNFYNIYSIYKTFFYKGGYSKTKAVVDKSALVAQKLKLIASKTGQSSQETTYGAQYVTQVAPANLRPGQSATIYAYFKNIGTSTWSKNGTNPVYIGNSSPQDRGSALTDGRNVRWQMLNSSVPPGRVGVFSLQIIAPAEVGTYVEKFRPLKEWVAWFGDETTLEINVSAAVSKTKK